MSFDLGDALWERRRRRYRGRDDSPQSQVEGFAAWCSDHVWIKHPLGKRRLALRPEQLEVAEAYIRNERTLCLKARQIGFTTVTMNFVLWRALFFDDWDTIILNRREEDAKFNLRMAALAYDELPPEIRAHLPKRLDNNVQKMTFDNGSVIESHPSNNNPARGRTARLMVLDEWAFMPNPDEAWAAVEPATDIGGQIVALSTANGWGNLFHQMWVGAMAGDNAFVAIFFPWSAVPERTQEWYEQKRKDMPGWQLAQEYPSDPTEAFIQSGHPFFDTDVLKRQPIDAPRVGELWSQFEGAPRGREWRQRAGGPLSVWNMPELYTSYVVGVDVAQGLEHGDYSSMHVINTKTGGIDAHWHGHIDPDLLGVEAAALAWWYNTALLGVESNNHGLTTLKAVARLNYPRIYMRRRYGHRREVVSQELGWYTSQATKPMMMDELAAAMRNDELILWDEGTRQEMMTYVRDAKGHLSGSPHDDRVMSLAVANQMRKHAYGPEQRPPDQEEPWTLAWVDRQARLAEKEAQAQRRVIGQHNVRR